eukprot:UN06424
MSRLSVAPLKLDSTTESLERKRIELGIKMEMRENRQRENIKDHRSLKRSYTTPNIKYKNNRP